MSKLVTSIIIQTSLAAAIAVSWIAQNKLEFQIIIFFLQKPPPLTLRTYWNVTLQNRIKIYQTAQNAATKLIQNPNWAPQSPSLCAVASKNRIEACGLVIKSKIKIQLQEVVTPFYTMSGWGKQEHDWFIPRHGGVNNWPGASCTELAYAQKSCISHFSQTFGCTKTDLTWERAVLHTN